MYACEIIVLDISQVVGNYYGALSRLYVADQGYMSQPDDSPANQPFLPLLVRPPNYAAEAPTGGLGGQATASYGELVLANPDGVLDDAITGSKRIVGVSVVVSDQVRGAWGNVGTAKASDFTPLVSGLTVTGVRAGPDTLTLSLGADRLMVYADYFPGEDVVAKAWDQPLTLSVVGGDSGDTRLPLVWGAVRNMPALVSSKASHIYQCYVDRGVAGDWGDGVAISAVYDRGVALTPDTTTFAGWSAFAAYTPAAGAWVTHRNGMTRYIKLGTAPAGQVTYWTTATGPATLRGLLTRLVPGATEPDAYGGVVWPESLDDDYPYDVAWTLRGDSTLKAVVDGILSAAGCTWGWRRDGSLFVARLADPAGLTPDLEVLAGEVMEITRWPWSYLPDKVLRTVTVRHSHCETVMGDSDLAAAATLDAEVRAEWAEVSDQTAYGDFMSGPLYDDIVVDTLLTSATDAAAEAARLVDLLAVYRHQYTVVLPTEVAGTVNIGDIVAIREPLWDLADGGPDGGPRSLLCLGVVDEPHLGRVTLTLWA